MLNPNYAGLLVGEPVSDAAAEAAVMPAAPEVIPIAVTRAPPPETHPHREITIDRYYSVTGDLNGLDVEAKPGHKIKQVRLRDLVDGRFKVEFITDPIGGRPKRVKADAE